MYPYRGRPSKVQREDIINTVLAYKDRIIISHHNIDKILSKHNVIWSEISNALCNRITSASLYTIVSCNRYGIRDKLIGRPKVNTTNSFNLSDGSNLNISDNTVDEKSMESINFIIKIPTHEFEELIVYTSYKRMQRNKMRKRIWKTLRPGIWEEFFTDKIWDATHLRCGFQFRNHYLSNIDTSGYINGKYKFLIIKLFSLKCSYTYMNILN